MRLLDAPLHLRGTVIKGFGRGSRELGIPTANLDAESLGAALEGVPAGIYFGWASVGASPVAHKMVMSIGWNPFYKNERKTVEPHLLHVFPADFYGEELRLVVLGYRRPEASYPSLETLIAAIHADIDAARDALDEPAAAAGAADPFLQPPPAAA
jgi:riboflavin kinase